MGERGWSILFGVVMFACLASFVAAPFVGWWLPGQLSTHAADIDRLFYIILAITGFFFVLTEALLVVFMWRYTGQPGQKPPAATPPDSLSAPAKEPFWTQHRIEMGWTVVPAAILLYIAFAQVSTWADVKYTSRMPAIGPKDAQPVQAGISARQFEWRITYPSPEAWEKWQKNPEDAKAWSRQQRDRDPERRHQIDDVRDIPNELHAIKGRPVLVQVSTLDVIHSFNLPHMRVKQDALPGRVIPVWFTPTQSNTVRVDRDGKTWWEDGGGHDPKTGQPKDPHLVWQIACAELCGRDHARMIGKLYVHETAADFEAWLRHTAAEQRRRSEK
jgi:cytochrome c oxidase subunit 2